MALGGLFAKKGGESAEPLRAPGPIDSKARLELLDQFEDAGLGWFWATDAEGRLIYLSNSATRQLGRDPGSLNGSALSSLFILDKNDDSEKAERPLAFLLSARNTIHELPVRIAVEDQEIWWCISGKPQLDAAGEFLGYRGSAKDITAVRESQRDASRMAQYDSLTGLANRHRMTKRLTTVLTAYKVAKRSCALMMLDLDRFKAVNDTLGHPAGDELLKQVAQRLERIIGNQGEIGRLGGDEFQVILPDIDDRGRLGDMAGRIIQMVSQPYSLGGARAIIGTSVGMAIAPYDGIGPDELVSAADLALYAAKGGGRGQYRFYSSDLKDGAKQRRQVEEDLRDAIQSDALELHYQPIVKAKDSLVSGFEALLRWNHPERGWISPAEFVPVAEDSNLIIPLGEWVMRRACHEAAAWPGELRVAVNVSAVQFANAELPQMVRKVLASSGRVPPPRVREINQSVLMGDTEG
ncbi:MAG: putative bifunctional diguanylate cyclase/phosphodiesterase, partial [Tsuneonella sp.]